MASEPEISVSSLIERLMAMETAMPVISSTINRPESDPDRESSDGPSRDRIILINPLTQGMVVIGGSSRGFDSLLSELMRKEGRPPASQTSIEAMASVEIESAGGECAICLEEWGVGETAKEMPCKHMFHGGCVEKWLKIHGTCPVCRYEMPVDDLGKKSGNEDGGRRRREIWVTFSFGSGRSRSNEEESSDS